MPLQRIFLFTLISLLTEAVQAITSTPPIWTASDYFKSGNSHHTQVPSHLYPATQPLEART